MSFNEIPVVVTGAGSQPAESDGAVLDYIDMPRGMDTYQRPETPEPEAVRHLTGARETMDWLQASLDHYRVGGPACLADISRLDRNNRELINQILGEGDVSLKYIGKWRINAQEAVLAGQGPDAGQQLPRRAVPWVGLARDQQPHGAVLVRQQRVEALRITEDQVRSLVGRETTGEPDVERVRA